MSSNGVLCGCHQIAAYILNKLGSGLVRSGDQQACIKHFKPRTKPQDCFYTLFELSSVICNPIGPPRGIPPLLPGVAPEPNDEPRRAGQGHRAGEDLRQASDALDGDGGRGRVRGEAEQRGQCLPVHAGQCELPEGPSRGACICLSELAFKVHPDRDTSAELMYTVVCSLSRAHACVVRSLCSKPGMRKRQSGTHEDGMGVHTLDSCQCGHLPGLHRSTSTVMQEEPNLISALVVTNFLLSMRSCVISIRVRLAPR